MRRYALQGCMASDELKIRAQIDQENVKAILLINGGGAVALLAFLPTVLGKPQYADLSRSILWALMTYQFGLAFAVGHNFLRRKCSQLWETYGYDPPRCRLFGHEFKSDPCLCLWSWFTLGASLSAFVGAGMLVALSAFRILAPLMD